MSNDLFNCDDNRNYSNFISIILIKSSNNRFDTMFNLNKK